jgi:hypothetical protein
MAKELGFFIIQTQRQYMGSVDDDALAEVRTELGFLDLIVQPGADPHLTRLLTRILTRQAPISAGKWHGTGTDPALCAYFATMRHTAEVRRRQDTLRALRQYVQEAGLYDVGGW